jgi:hypothetical protein
MVYNAEPADEATANQNRAFHAILGELYRSGAYSYPAKSLNELKNFIKRDAVGFESYVIITETESGLAFMETADIEEARNRAARDDRGRPLIKGKLKSWADFTKRERAATIDYLISYCLNCGLDTPHFEEILKGMEENSMRKAG